MTQTAFCESGAPNAEAAGEEYLHLPAIVDAAESSPAAAKEAAVTIRRYLSKDHYSRGFAQYNAIMLTRILTDNPAHLFTQNFDAKFVSTVKELLREGRDSSVQQILRETLDYFEAEKLPGNDTLNPLIEMWRKEKGKRNALRYSVGWGSIEAVGYDQRTEHHQQQNRVPPTFAGNGRQQSSRRRRDTLPPPEELVSRIEEAKTTARLLVQTVQSTSQSELLANELVKEFAERAQTAQRSIQGFLNAQNPAPDPDTMLTLIETNDHLNIAMSKHQRAVLQARKSAGLATPSPHLDTTTNPLGRPQQHQVGQNVYSNTTSPSDGLYSASPPHNESALPRPLSPERQDQQFAPPPGPPPAAQGAYRNHQSTHSPTTSFDYASAYAAPSGPPPRQYEQAPPVPERVRPQSPNYSQPPVAASSAYGVSENPFADDAYGDDSNATKRPNALFDRNQAIPSLEPLQLEQNRPGPGVSSTNTYQPTPSYIQRQDSAAAHITVHGASPPPNQFGQDPVSPIDDTHGTGKKFNELRI